MSASCPNIKRACFFCVFKFRWLQANGVRQGYKAGNSHTWFARVNLWKGDPPLPDGEHAREATLLTAASDTFAQKNTLPGRMGTDNAWHFFRVVASGAGQNQVAPAYQIGSHPNPCFLAECLWFPISVSQDAQPRNCTVEENLQRAAAPLATHLCHRAIP